MLGIYRWATDRRRWIRNNHSRQQCVDGELQRPKRRTCLLATGSANATRDVDFDQVFGSRLGQCFSAGNTAIVCGDSPAPLAFRFIVFGRPLIHNSYWLTAARLNFLNDQHAVCFIDLLCAGNVLCTEYMYIYVLYRISFGLSSRTLDFGCFCLSSRV